MTMLERLISIRTNADERASYKLNEENRYNSYITKANLLESGIIQLIIEIQNNIVKEKIQKGETKKHKKRVKTDCEDQFNRARPLGEQLLESYMLKLRSRCK